MRDIIDSDCGFLLNCRSCVRKLLSTGCPGPSGQLIQARTMGLRLTSVSRSFFMRIYKSGVHPTWEHRFYTWGGRPCGMLDALPKDVTECVTTGVCGELQTDKLLIRRYLMFTTDGDLAALVWEAGNRRRLTQRREDATLRFAVFALFSTLREN